MKQTILRCVVAAYALFMFDTAIVLGSLVLLGSFDPGVGELVGLAYERDTDTVWIHGGGDSDIRQYSSSGVFLSSIPRPGESADDFDLEFAPESLSISGVLVPAGTLLATNGETDVAEIYALDKTNGNILATLNTNFGLSHVVGGSYHPLRDTFFLVQDRQPSGSANDSVVAEIDPSSGAVLNTFKIDVALPGYTINFGDVEVSSLTGNLIFASSDETTFAEFTPSGTFVQQIDRPAGPSSLSGIGLHESAGEIWVSGTGGTVWRLGGLPVPEPGSVSLTLLVGTGMILRRSLRRNSLA